MFWLKIPGCMVKTQRQQERREKHGGLFFRYTIPLLPVERERERERERKYIHHRNFLSAKLTNIGPGERVQLKKFGYANISLFHQSAIFIWWTSQSWVDLPDRLLVKDVKLWRFGFLLFNVLKKISICECVYEWPSDGDYSFFCGYWQWVGWTCSFGNKENWQKRNHFLIEFPSTHNWLGLSHTN